MSKEFKQKDPLDISLYLKDNGMNDSVCQSFEDNEIDGEAFLELTIEELNVLIPNKLGIVKKIYRLIQSMTSSVLKDPSHPVQGQLNDHNECDGESVSSHQSSKVSQTSRSVSSQESSKESSDGVSSQHSTVSLSDKHELFTLPDCWRPSVMHAIQAKSESEQRQSLTPDVRNAIVRDVVSTMYAYAHKPNKEFCTSVVKKLVKKYPFMKDVGSGVSGFGSWEKKLIERVHNVAKTGKRGPIDEAELESRPKRGRPKSVHSLLYRYPPVNAEVTGSEEDEEALQKEAGNEKPRKEMVLTLQKRTFSCRRSAILSEPGAISTLLGKFKCFSLTYVLEMEVDMILKRKEAVKNAMEDWTSKWAPAIIDYAVTVKGKLGKSCLDVLDMFSGEEQAEEKRALCLLVLFLVKGEWKDNLVHIYEEFQIAEDIGDLVQRVVSPSPMVVCLKNVSEEGVYGIVVEKKVVVSGITSFTKALGLWFAVHYILNLEYNKAVAEVLLFMQEFVYGLPAPTLKKSSTYLSICSNIQSYTKL